MVQSDSEWLKTGSKRFKTGLISQKVVQKWLKEITNGQKWLKENKNGFKMF